MFSCLQLELDAELQTMRIGDEATNQYFPDAFDGSTHYWVLINQHKLEFGRLGETKSLECQSDRIIENIIIWSQSDMTIAFYGTCPDAEFYDFDHPLSS